MERRSNCTRFDCQFAWYFSHRYESFSVGFEWRKCPRASAQTSARRTRPTKEEEEEGSKEDEEKAPAGKRRKVSKSLIDDLKCLNICVTITFTIFILQLHGDN